MNTITINGNKVRIAKHNRPFLLPFTEIGTWVRFASVAVGPSRGADSVSFSIVRVKDKKEQEREYMCVYSSTGELLKCRAHVE